MPVTPFDASSTVGPSNGQLTVPVSITSTWFTAVDATGPNTQDASTVTNPTTQITAAAKRLCETKGRATRATFRLKYNQDVSTPTSPVIAVFGRTRVGATEVGPWERLWTLGATATATLTLDTTNDVTDGSYKTTSSTLESQTFDLMGCNEFLVGVQTAFAASGGTVNDSTIECKLT